MSQLMGAHCLASLRLADQQIALSDLYLVGPLKFRPVLSINGRWISVAQSMLKTISIEVLLVAISGNKPTHLDSMFPVLRPSKVDSLIPVPPHATHDQQPGPLVIHYRVLVHARLPCARLYTCEHSG